MSVDPVSLVITAALTAAQMAVSALQEFEGPRLTDNGATLADYGATHNYFIGTRLLSCPCFFAKPIRDEAVTNKGKGGKQTTHTGYGSWAVHIAGHPVSRILAMWFDNHLVYDRTGSGAATYPLGDSYDIAATMRFYDGSETQLPDPDMEAYLASLGRPCSAHRGTSYLYLENVPLQQLGNRYPDVKILAVATGPADSGLGDGPDIVAEAAASLSIFGGTSVSPSLPSTPADDSSVFVAAVMSFATGAHSCATPGWTKAAEAQRPEGLTLSVWTAPDSAAAPTFTWGTSANHTAMVKRVADTGGTTFPAVTISDYGSSTTDLHIGPGLVTGAPRVGVLLVDAARGFTFPGSDPAGWTGHGGQFSFAGSMKWWSRTAALPGTDTGDAAVTWGAAVPWIRIAIELRSTSSLEPTDGTLEQLLTFVAERAGLEPDEYDFSQATQTVPGYNWSQGTGRQACDAIADLFDVDLRPHDFVLQALPRGGASAGLIDSGEFVRKDDSPPHELTTTAPRDLPRRVFLNYADTTAQQNPNVASPVGQPAATAGSDRELSVDMSSLALAPATAQQLVERKLRRVRFGATTARLALTRQRLVLEPGDVLTPVLDSDAMTMRLTKLSVEADGAVPTEWERDDPAIASLSGSAGAPASGIVPDTVPDGLASRGAVMDLPLIADAHEQSAPLAYLVAGPDGPGTWLGAGFAASDTGELDSYAEGWATIAAGAGAVIGTCAGALADTALPWVPDMASTLTVTLNQGSLTAATLDALQADPLLNLAAIRSGTGWELVQFMTPTLTGTRTYDLTGFLRGLRGSEWATGGHVPGDMFVLMDRAVRKTMGAAEIGDTDWYVVTSTGDTVDQDTAFAEPFTGASHKPYSPVHGLLTRDAGSGDWAIAATRRTRLGGGSVNGSDVPLGEASEAWAAEIWDGVTLKRTLTGTSLPLAWTAAQQTTDFGAPVTTGFAVLLYQIDPVLSLRGYPLALSA